MYNNAVTEECLMVIDWAIDDLIQIGKLYDLSDDALIVVAAGDTLVVKELDLFKLSGLTICLTIMKHYRNERRQI